MPTQSGPCSSIAAASRAPNVGMPTPARLAAHQCGRVVLLQARDPERAGLGASIACTAAPSCCTVVTIALSAAVVAARIS